ncbi:hypothetical protein C0J52_18287 [Blattella germanica]|nr:hypothetical protein C0J52_18287 [Blattella germanica]
MHNLSVKKVAYIHRHNIWIYEKERRCLVISRARNFRCKILIKKVQISCVNNHTNSTKTNYGT